MIKSAFCEISLPALSCYRARAGHRSADLSVKHYGKTPGAVLIPILEDEAVMTYRCYVMNRNKDAFLPFREKFA